MSIKVYSAEEALESVKANPSKVLVAEKKSKDKSYKGSKFLMAKFNIGTDVKREGWFTIMNILLTIGVADPTDKNDRRNEHKGTRMQVQTTLSNAGAIGQFLHLLNPVWFAYVNELSASGMFIIGSRKIHGLMQYNLSESNEKNPGGAIDDPIIRFKLDFSPFPEGYPHKFLVGKPRTVIYDYNKSYVDEKGVTQYRIATVTNDKGIEEPVGEANVHKFITKGSIIRKGRLMITSIAISQSWISLIIILNSAVIEQGSADGFSDEPNLDFNNLAITAPPPVDATDKASSIKGKEPVKGSDDDLDDLIENF